MELRNSFGQLGFASIALIAGCGRMATTTFPTPPLVGTLTSKEMIEGIIGTVDPNAKALGGTSGGGGGVTTDRDEVEASWSKTYTGVILSSAPLEDFYRALSDALSTELRRGGAEIHSQGGGEERAGEAIVRATFTRTYTAGEFRGDLLIVLLVDGASVRAGDVGYYLVVHVNEVYLGD